jgi:serine/threonine-protein kinase RsbT
MEQDDRPLDAPRDLAELTALIRRVVSARVSNRDAVDDIVQETVARLLAMKDRLDGRAIGPYAVVTARNLVASQWRRADTGKRHEHRLLDPRRADAPDDVLVERRRRMPCGPPRAPDAARAGGPRRSRGRGAGHALARRRPPSTPGCGRRQLARSRAKLRVEYLIELDRDPPTPQCRPVLVALSAATDAARPSSTPGYHLLDCDYCAALSQPLFDRRVAAGSDEVRVAVEADPTSSPPASAGATSPCRPASPPPRRP